MDVPKNRTLTRYGCLAALILMAFTCNECLAAKNPLIGTWKWDNAKTLQEFQSPTEGSAQLKESAARAKAFAEAIAKHLNSNVTLTYTDKVCTEIVLDRKGDELSRESFPYKIIENNKDYVIVDQPNNGGVGRLFLEGNHFYVEVKVGEYTYQDYFTKL